jgi:hypothetical protein
VGERSEGRNIEYNSSSAKSMPHSSTRPSGRKSEKTMTPFPINLLYLL